MSELAQRAEPGTLRVLLAGDCPGAAAVSEALEREDELDLLRADAGAAPQALAQWDVDAVLFATPGPDLPVEELAALREHTSAPIVVLAPASAPQVLGAALAADVADALLLPQPVEAVMFALRKATGRRSEAAAPRTDGRIITVFSPKGGTGKTITATSLALSLATDGSGRRVLLIDLDLQFGDCAIVLGLDTPKTIHDLVSAPGELDAEKLSGYTVAHPSGLDLLSAPKRPEEAEFVPVGKVVRLLEASRESYDVIVVDSSPFLHGPILAAIDHADDLLLLATLDVPTLKDVRQSLETLELLSYPTERISMVLNRADAHGGLNRGEVEEALGVRFRFKLPSDSGVQIAINRGNPIVLSDPRAKFSQAIRDVATELVAPAARGVASVGRGRA